MLFGIFVAVRSKLVYMEEGYRGKLRTLLFISCIWYICSDHKDCSCEVYSWLLILFCRSSGKGISSECLCYLYAKMVAGIGCILGHCYPVTMKFRGGKGVAAFAGMVLTYHVWFAIPIVLIGTALLLLLNTGVAAPMVGRIVSAFDRSAQF